MIDRQTKVRALLNNLSLRETLRPLWTITYYFGIQLDWCVSDSSEKRSIFFIRCLSVIIISSFNIIMILFEFCQLIIGIMKMTTVHDIIPTLIWFIPLTLSVTCQIKYLVGRHELLSFFESWHNLEKEIDLRYKHRNITAKPINKIRKAIVCYYVIMWVALLSGLSYIIIQFPESPFLLSNYQWLNNFLGLSFIRFIHLSDLVLHFILISLSDVVPAIIFYHASLAIRVLAEEVEVCVTGKILFSARLRQIWLSYGVTSKLVERANIWYGPLILFDHGIKFFLTSTMFYLTLYNFQNDTFKAEVYFIKLIIGSINITICNLLASRLHCASTNLKMKLHCIINQYWDSMDKQDRDTLTAFLNQVQHEELAACPLNLYKVTPSILLTFLSLTTSYVIVLIQSK